MRNIKEISIKDQTYHFLNDMIRSKMLIQNYEKLTKIRTQILIFITLDISQ